MEYSYHIKVVKNRLGVLIGPKGEIKNRLEEATSCKLMIDSKEGTVKLEGNDPIQLFILKNVVTAIGRGFNPDIAQLLLKQDYIVEFLSLRDFASTDKQLKRLKGRVIGNKGKSRSTIERLTDCYISVFGKTISIVGRVDYLPVARSAVDMLLKGANHNTVFKMLEQKRREFIRNKAINLGI